MPAVTPAAKARRKAQKREYYLRNRERELARTAAWVVANPARSSEIKRAWRARNPDADREYYEANKPARRAIRDAYRARCRQAMPPWVDRKAILAVYKEAKQRGMSVDHVVPLKGATFCGLHVQWNLQIISLADNIRKGNRYAG